MSRLAVFRCDAGAAIGTGHVMRCLALAGVLAGRGWRCLLAGRPGSFETLGTRLPERVALRKVGTTPAALVALAPGGCDLAVVDHYGLGADYESALRPWAGQLLAIDDLADRPHACDLLLDQTLGRKTADYAPHTGDSTRLLLGSAYALLRPDFAAARPQVLEERLGRNAPPEAARILITLGGLPQPGHLAVALSGVAAAAPGAELIAVAPRHAAAELASRFRGVRWLHEVADMASLFASCDLAIGAGGTTAWERCCLGLPSVVLEVAANQRLICEALNGAGAALAVGRIEEAGAAGRIAAAVGRLAGDTATRREMARRAALVCDGLGARRVAAALEPQRARAGGTVTLRPATAWDSEAVLTWQSEPEARRYARNPSPPTPEEHAAWFARRLAEPRHGPFEIVLEHGRPVGFVRLDRLGREGSPRHAAPASNGRPCYLVSILISRAAAGRGLGAAALRLVAQLMAGSSLYAEVLEGNRLSHALFGAAGYERVSAELYRQDC